MASPSLALALLGLLVIGAGCSDPRADTNLSIEQPPRRSGRLGSLRDLVLVERAGLSAGKAVFVDRFEVTEDDWREFAATARGGEVGAAEVALTGNGSLPVSGVDLAMARAFAHWRCLRLPSVLEWELVTVGDGRSMFPWGSKQDPSRANTGELALGSATPVGTFESGRRANSDAPYDLIGNVGEWTEWVPGRWCSAELGLPVSFELAVRRARATAALAAFGGPGGLVPLGAVAMAGGADVPHVVVGSDFQTPMTELYGEQLAGERRQRTGLRLYSTAAELVERLGREPATGDPAERVQLQRFVWRGRHRQVLQEAAAAAATPLPNSVGAQLLDILGTADGNR